MNSDKKVKWIFYLFISKETIEGDIAVSRLEEICETYLSDQYDIHLIDVAENPEACIQANIIAIPTLVRKYPKPEKKIIGDLSNKEKLLSALNIIDPNDPE